MKDLQKYTPLGKIYSIWKSSETEHPYRVADTPAQLALALMDSEEK
jgi:hypothetical protein